MGKGNCLVYRAASSRALPLAQIALPHPAALVLKQAEPALFPPPLVARGGVSGCAYAQARAALHGDEAAHVLGLLHVRRDGHERLAAGASK